ncbi:MAG: beta-galactosidase [Armatimonadota bacterium]
MADLQPHFHGLGAAFFPEHHPRETWDEYASLLAGAGFSFVRMAEFTWDKMEPREGEYDFAWLDDIMGRLDRYGIKVILCTPTAVPPIWACEKYPEIHPVMDNGKVFGFGIRRYTCPTSIAYHTLNERLVSALAEHYGDNPQVLAWQLDNEFGHPFCFCPRCLQAFQQWCRARFGTIERFNDALCTHFLGQTFQDFSQIAFPITYSHPGMWLMYHRFFSDATIECYRKQVETLKSHGVQAPVTTNMMPTWYGYDHEQMGTHLDVIAGDHYALSGRTNFGGLMANEMFVNAYLRGMKGGQNVWYHEFQCGVAGTLPLPGQVRWETLTQIGLGADLINYFRFDTCPNGMERDGLGLLRVHRKPGRVYGEMQALNQELKGLQPLLDGSTPPRAKIAMLFTHDNHCEFARSHKPAEFAGNSGNGYSIHLARHYQAIVKQNITCDIVYPHADFSAYDVIVAPALYILPADLAERLKTFVANGGTLLLTSATGMADEHATILDHPLPGPLAEACGIEVRDYGIPNPTAGPVCLVSTMDAFSPLGEVKYIDEILPQSDAVEVLARFDNHFYQDIPALTRHAYQAGTAYYLGTVLTEDGYNTIYRMLTTAWDLHSVLDLPEGVYSFTRINSDTEILFISNPHTESREVTLPGGYLCNGQAVSGTVQMKPFDVLVLTRAVVKELV